MSMKINDELLMWWLMSLVRAAFSHNIYKYTYTLKGLSVTQLIVYTRNNNTGRLRGCLVCSFKQPFSVFKQHFTHFNALFHPHVFPQIFSNNNFQFLNTYTKRVLSVTFKILMGFFIFLRGNHMKFCVFFQP